MQPSGSFIGVLAQHEHHVALKTFEVFRSSNRNEAPQPDGVDTRFEEDFQAERCEENAANSVKPEFLKQC